MRNSSRTALFLLIGLLPGLVSGQTLRTDHPDEYVVQEGDTLWDISGRFLEDPWLWPEIWQVNEQIADPHLIFPGDVLRLVYIDGQPRLVVDRPGSTIGSVVKLSPQMRETRHQEAISSIPLDAVREFFTRNLVTTEEEMEAAPYMVSGPEGRIMVGQGDMLYVRGDIQDDIKMYGIFNLGDEYRDPQTGEVLGYRAESKGTARYQNTAVGISRMNVMESFAEISVGDRFLPLAQDQFDSQLFPEVPSEIISGQIMAVEGGVSQIGVLDVVAINRGAQSGLEVGHLLAIMEGGQEVRDRVAGQTIKLPDEQAGILMVFKIYEKMSFGLVLETEKSLSVGHKVTSLFSAQAYEQNRAELEESQKGNGFFNLEGITDMFKSGLGPK